MSNNQYNDFVKYKRICMEFYNITKSLFNKCNNEFYLLLTINYNRFNFPVTLLI